MKYDMIETMFGNIENLTNQFCHTAHTAHTGERAANVVLDHLITACVMS